MVFSRGLTAAALAVLAAAPLAAQDDAESEMVRKVRALGAGIGNAYVCTDPDGHDVFREEAHHLFDLILQDAGSDIAYFYATAVGFGAAAPADDIDCAAMLAQWEGIRADYDLQADQ